MIIKVKMTRPENIDYYGVRLGDTVPLELEDYLCGVVPSEVYESRTPTEALKAQAICARTYAVRKHLDGATMDDTANNQAYRVTLAKDSPRSAGAVRATEGLVLMYGGDVIQCYYSNSNGGRTKRTEEVWSKALPYYASRADPWDVAARFGKDIKASHGVGLSQVGAEYAAEQGRDCNSILAFYYPGAEITKKERNINMTHLQLIAIFALMAAEKWAYVYGAAVKGKVDCSGAFVYAFKQFGLDIAHGSNAIWRYHLTSKGKIGEIQLVPGMAVFKLRNDGQEPDKYKADGIGNMYHMGLYIGDGKVVHAKGEKHGVVTEGIDTGWTHAGHLKQINYSVEEEETMNYITVVADSGNTVNLRAEPSTSAVVLAKVPIGSQVAKLDIANGWTKVSYAGSATEKPVTGWIMDKFLSVPAESNQVSDIDRTKLEKLYELSYALTIQLGEVLGING